MTGVIKANADSAAAEPIRAFAMAPQVAPSVLPGREALLEERIAALQAAIAEAGERHAADVERACEEAAAAALEQRSDAEERALAIIAESAAKAREAWEKRLGSWEPLAIAISSAVLEKVFADAGERSALLESGIKHRLALLGANSAARLRVSAKDFADADAVRLGASGAADIVVDAGLRSGECLVELKLGEVDLGLDAQWTRIADTLATIARESAPC